VLAWSDEPGRVDGAYRFGDGGESRMDASELPLAINDTGRYGELSGRPRPKWSVLLFIPTLAAILTRAEQLKGAELTHEEVFRIRDDSAVLVSPPEAAQAVEERRGYADVDPRRSVGQLAGSAWPGRMSVGVAPLYRLQRTGQPLWSLVIRSRSRRFRPLSGSLVHSSGGIVDVRLVQETFPTRALFCKRGSRLGELAG
jgi:hypothetical protein